MHDAGPLRIKVRVAQIGPMGQKGVHKRAGAMPGARVYDDASGLVHNQHGLILEKDV